MTSAEEDICPRATAREGSGRRPVAPCLDGLQRGIGRHAGLQPRADRPGTGARQLQKRGGPKSLPVREEDAGVAREVVVDADARVQATERTDAGGTGPTELGRALVEDVVAEPVPPERGGDDQAVARAEESFAISQVSGDTRRRRSDDHALGAELTERALRRGVLAVREGLVDARGQRAAVLFSKTVDLTGLRVLDADGEVGRLPNSIGS